MDTKICVDCHTEWPLDRFRADNPCPDSCFRCRSEGVSLSLQGGKEYWNADTEARRSERALSEARAAGFDPIPAETGKGWSGASAKSLASVGEISKKNGAFGVKPSGTPSVGSVGAKA